MSTIWNDLDRSSTIVLSNGGLTVNYTGGGNVDNICRSFHPCGVGQFYFESTIPSLGSSGTVAVGAADRTQTGEISSAGAIGYFPNISQAWGNWGGPPPKDLVISGLPKGANGCEVDTFIDTVAERMCWRVNNGGWFGSSGAAADPLTGSGCLDISFMIGDIYAACECGSNGGQINTRFKRLAWVRTPPADALEIGPVPVATRAYTYVIG